MYTRGHHLLFGIKHRLRSGEFFSNGGFTLVEIVVVIGIVVILMSVVLVSFPQLSERILIRKAGQQLVLDIRTAQNKAFAVRTIQCPASVCGTSQPIIPKGFGLRIRRSNDNYFIFADINNNQTYEVGIDVLLQTTRFERGLKITNIQDSGGIDFCTTAPGDVDIGFSSPAARMKIYCNGIVQPTAQVRVVITSPGVSIQTTVISVITTGQVLVQ